MSERMLENRTYDEISVGDYAELTQEITEHLIQMFAITSGDSNPVHLDRAYAEDSMFHGVVAHGMLGAGLISTVLGTKLPGPGTIYLGQDLKFLKPVRPGDKITVRVTVTAKEEKRHRVTLDCRAINQEGVDVIVGVANVMAPTNKIRCAAATLPDVSLFHRSRMNILIDKAKKHQPLRTAVVHPCDAVSLLGAIESAQEGLLVPVFVGPETRIRAVAEQAEIDIGSFEIIDTPHSHAAVEKAVSMARFGAVESIMKGSLHTDELMEGILSSKGGLRTELRASHAFVMDVPTHDDFLLITDAAVNILPTVMQKRDICQNVIHMAHDIGIPQPRVALLAATETVNVNMPATLEAAVLCKMADRGQITGGELDGPLAFDNAVSAEAVRIKKINSAVAGRADVLVVPNIESGNMLVKQLVYLSSAQPAGIVCGLRVPVTLTSRADSPQSRLASSALAVLSHAGEVLRRTQKQEQRKVPK